MHIERVHNNRAVKMQLLLYALPTVALMFLVLYNFNVYFNLLKNEFVIQGIYFAIGIMCSILFYARNFRITTTFAVLLLIYFLAFNILGNVSFERFDIFSTSIQFLSFSVLFSIGWLAGYGFSRWNGFTIAWVIFLLSTQIYAVSRTEDINTQNILTNFLPFIFYCFYIIYITELIKNTDDSQKNYTILISRRVLSFLLLFLLLFVPIFYFFNDDFKQIEKTWENVLPQYNEKQKNTENMTRQNKDGTIENKESSKLTGNLSRGKGLAFVAYLNNFLEDGTPNPLYFISNYYTKFDTITQTFEVDTKMPFDDLYKPDPSKIPLFFNDTDSTVIKNGMSILGRKEVYAEVYKSMLSPDEYIAPATAFYCQPISIPRDNIQQFRSAYKAKMWVSELNSAYFVYNTGTDEDAIIFQNKRAEILRADTNYALVDKNFLQYYTYIPKDESFKRIDALAQQIISKANATTNIDKILAIKNYYLRDDEFGQPLFTYSENPGIPGLPNASRLNYFLFENRKGYCTYFAGTTLFLLRALGIPSRIAAGFMTIDRSTNKNLGWYWFYEDQAHAWVQVFFPNYGWIDFDTTIPDANSTQATQPDGTPPLGLKNATFVADGEIMSIDTIQKTASIAVNKIIINNLNKADTASIDIFTDISLANIVTDTAEVNVDAIKKGMHVTAVSYDDKLVRLPVSANNSFKEVAAALPIPLNLDELKIIEKEDSTVRQHEEIAPIENKFDWLVFLSRALWILITGILLLIALPYMIFLFFKWRANKSIHHQNAAILFYLNQMGLYRNKISPLEFARQTDEIFNTNFEKFTALHQKQKYSKKALTKEEHKFVKENFKNFLKKVKEKIPLKTRLNNFININATLHYFIKD